MSPARSPLLLNVQWKVTVAGFASTSQTRPIVSCFNAPWISSGTFNGGGVAFWYLHPAEFNTCLQTGATVFFLHAKHTASLDSRLFSRSDIKNKRYFLPSFFFSFFPSTQHDNIYSHITSRSTTLEVARPSTLTAVQLYLPADSRVILWRTREWSESTMPAVTL